MTFEYHRETDWKLYRVTDPDSTAYELMINGESVFAGKTDQLTK